MGKELELARPVSELQTSGPSLVRQAKRNGALALTRYGKTVAFLVSPEVHHRQEELEQAANRALWALDIQRGLQDLEAGDVVEWNEMYGTLDRELTK